MKPFLFFLSVCTHLMGAQPNGFQSQASQDRFVYALLYQFTEKNDPGYYLEIGAGEPIQINNSYFFETQLGWQGTSIDISQDLGDRWSQARNNPLLQEDATKTDYRSLLRSYPSTIDYLSLDVDGYYDAVLEKLPFDEYTFKVITIEHDAYRFGDTYRSKEREILSNLGYQLLCSNVSNDGHPFEDWWIYPSAFCPCVLSQLTTLDLNDKEHSSIIEALKSLLAK